nr:NAD(P)/FAD-dependent oxidoreductase [Planococcus faecalis]
MVAVSYGRAEIDPLLTGAELPSDKVRAMAQQLTAFTMFVNGTQSIEKAFVTGGGVSIKEIEPKTMASKKNLDCISVVKF